MKKLTSLLCVLFSVLSCENDDSSIPVEIPSIIAEFKTNLSELNLFIGDLQNLELSTRAFEYETSTPLFTDYAHKQRLIALPDNTSMVFNGDGLPIFPDNTVIAKTFYYNFDERDPSLGRKIIETRVLIKINGNWESGDYVWTDDQSDAILELNGRTLPISWTDLEGNTQSTNYQIPANTDCFTCHSSYDNMTPIGPKLRSMNFVRDGINQLQNLIDSNTLIGLENTSGVTSIPNWRDETVGLDQRARAYMDINCAHCHTPGGYCYDQSTLNLDFNTPLIETNIANRKASINVRVSDFNDGFSMPFTGTTMLHSEGVSLIQEYLDTL